MKIRMSDVLPSPISFLTITATAIVGINLAKALARRHPFFRFGGLVDNA